MTGPEGEHDLVTLPNLKGEGELGVRIERGTLRHIDSPHHRSDALHLGFRDGLDLALDVLDKWNLIRKKRPK